MADKDQRIVQMESLDDKLDLTTLGEILLGALLVLSFLAAIPVLMWVFFHWYEFWLLN